MVRSRGQGFTLVELLVVLGIISVLIVMVFPAVTGGTDEANKIACAKNLQQIGIAANNFHTMVTKGRRWPANEELATRVTKLQGLRSIEPLYQGKNPILESTKVLQCPANGANLPSDFNGEIYPRSPWNFDLVDSAYLWNIQAPKPADDLNKFYLASDRVTNHDGVNILFYSGEVNFFDKDAFEETVENWDSSSSKIYDGETGELILQP